jgi:glycosyltransferase A (GT-A) superfamily protein (DUF2064 family)
VLSRAVAHLRGPRYLALAGRAAPGSVAAGAAGRAVEQQAAEQGWRVIDQGAGDLGQRLGHVWQAVGSGPVVFLGVDCPDVPGSALAAIEPALTEAEAAVGPVSDGGYWTLAARAYQPALLDGIDWGSDRVHAQTHAAAKAAGLRLIDLPAWYDVDDMDDLRKLRARLRDATEPSLTRLRQALDTCCGFAL